MEFHDILHGHICFRDGDPLTALLRELINSPEIHRLRNMRQMNFDVPLIQELGRSRRLPHSIGVAHIAHHLGIRSALSLHDAKILLTAAILHDAAIPPYGHLVESEFKNISGGFNHEKRVEELIKGTINLYLSIVPGKSLKLPEILRRNEVDPDDVIKVICPPKEKTPISADIDLDNIDNVHRMAAMLGWEGVRENLQTILSCVRLRGLGQMSFSREAVPALKKWLHFRQRIYAMIIAHPECIPYNALQTDLVRLAVKQGVISPSDWWMSEPEFEEKLRQIPETRSLATQLISGCEYQLIDYVWVKDFLPKKMSNAYIAEKLASEVQPPIDHGYFVWNEKGLISRTVHVRGEGWHGEMIGFNSVSCMIALVKKTPGKPKWSKQSSSSWRRDAVQCFAKLFESHEFGVDFPETYTGGFRGKGSGELGIDYY
jgi:HD superfamily phosphohydrolase